MVAIGFGRIAAALSGGATVLVGDFNGGGEFAHSEFGGLG